MERRWPLPIDRETRMLGVALVDVALIAVVLGIGLTRHAVDPVARPGYLLRTVAPFWLGWAIATTAFGGYASRRATSLGWSVVVTASSWSVAVLIGGSIRETALVPGGAPPIFLGVTIGVGLLVLLPWRIIVALAPRSSL